MRWKLQVHSAVYPYTQNIPKQTSGAGLRSLLSESFSFIFAASMYRFDA